MRKTRKELLAYIKELINNEHPDDGDAQKAVEEFEALLDMEEIFKRELYFKKGNNGEINIYNQNKVNNRYVVFGNNPVHLNLSGHETKLFFRFLHRDILITKQRKLLEPKEPEV